VSARTARNLWLALSVAVVWLLGSPPSASAEAEASEQPAQEQVSAHPAAPTEAETVAEPEQPAPRAPLCTGTKLRLVGAIAASVNSFALVRSPAGTALLSPGERLNGHELLIVGAHQALMRNPTGDPCRLLLYHRSDADK